ncbi:MAG: DNA-directed RNA polymerase subunit alpha C-terminal domain-containing protein [Xanthobacteraceae bacterium]|jgi:DNA-directed RNA polymerase alpha subunit
MSREDKASPGMTVAERKALRKTEAQQATDYHEQTQQAFQQNLERLRAERRAREAVAGPMLRPLPGLPDATPVEQLKLTPRIKQILQAAGVKTVGDIRRRSDKELRSLPKLGPGAVKSLRESLGPASAAEPDGTKPG